MTELTQVMAVSLESSKRYFALAIYDGSRLALTHCISLIGPPSKWRDELIKNIKKKSEEGFIVLVEDRTEVFCVGDSSPFSFEEMLEGRSMLFHSLDWYFAMLDMGQIMAAEKSIESFMIRGGAEGQKIEKMQDEKGRTVYKVDWSSVSGGHKAVLMCVAGAMMQPLSDRFLSAMYGPIGEDEFEVDNEKSWRSITKGVTETRIKKWDSYYN